MKWYIPLVALFLSFTPANATVVISDIDGGGQVGTYLSFWHRIADSGENVVIDGICISACTFFLGVVPENRVCMTARAALGLHQLNMNDEPDPDTSAVFFHWLYPAWVQQWIKNHGGLSPDPIYMYPEDTMGHIRLCTGQQYETVKPEQLIKPEQKVEDMPINLPPPPK